MSFIIVLMGGGNRMEIDHDRERRIEGLRTKWELQGMSPPSIFYEALGAVGFVAACGAHEYIGLLRDHPVIAESIKEYVFGLF